MSKRRENKRSVKDNTERLVRSMFERYDWCCKRIWNAPIEQCEPYQWGVKRNLILNESHPFNDAHDVFEFLTPFINIQMSKTKKEWWVESKKSYDYPYRSSKENGIFVGGDVDTPPIGIWNCKSGPYHPLAKINHLEYKHFSEKVKKWLMPARRWSYYYGTEVDTAWYQFDETRASANNIWSLNITPRIIDYIRIYEPEVVAERDYLHHQIFNKHYRVFKKLFGRRENDGWRITKDIMLQKDNIKNIKTELDDLGVDAKIKTATIPWHKD